MSISDAPPINEAEAPRAARFKVRLSRPLARSFSVSYRTINGTARAGTDFVGRSGVLEFRPGRRVRTVRVMVLQDRRVERTERFQVELSDARGGAAIARRTASGVIVDDD